MLARLENIILYLVCTLTWGSTWLVITFQVDSAPASTSVFWRFAIASLSIFLFLIYKKYSLKYPLRNHLLFAAQGVLMFSINYILTYIAETTVTSGLIALTFTSLVYFNIFGMRVYFKKPIEKNVLWGALIGAIGLSFIFINELAKFKSDWNTINGIILGFIATFSASSGNMVAQKSWKENIPIAITNGFGMLYGCFFTLLVVIFNGDSLAVPMNPKFILSLLYLAIFGTSIAFGAYLLLAGKIGAEKASYSNIVSPIIALILSSFFEELLWTPMIIVGVFLCLIGNVLTLSKAVGKFQGAEKTLPFET